jgi:hypothetical protein
MIEDEEDLPDEEPYVDRRWTLPKKLWDQILEMSESTGINYAELVCMLLEDGLKIRMRIPIESARPDPPPPPWTTCHVEHNGKVLGRLNMRQVPAADEVLTVDGRSYLVVQRAWTVVKGEAEAYLRVEEFSA